MHSISLSPTTRWSAHNCCRIHIYSWHVFWWYRKRYWCKFTIEIVLISRICKILSKNINRRSSSFRSTIRCNTFKRWRFIISKSKSTLRPILPIQAHFKCELLSQFCARWCRAHNPHSRIKIRPHNLFSKFAVGHYSVFGHILEPRACHLNESASRE